ncbi:MAG TPA: PrgI family protein [Candidatus Paceibacterota bacterium]|nr:PrgI family protein [Candidatus Paceibacterota bacterium]
MRFEVPQFIEIEDKIIGPLTWKQFVYVAGGVGILVILWVSLPTLLFLLFGLPFGILAGSLAFHRVNNRPFSIFLESFLSYAGKGKLYLWRKDAEQSVIERTDTSDVAVPKLEFANRNSIHELSRKLETQIPADPHG